MIPNQLLPHLNLLMVSKLTLSPAIRTRTGPDRPAAVAKTSLLKLNWILPTSSNKGLRNLSLVLPIKVFILLVTPMMLKGRAGLRLI